MDIVSLLALVPAQYLAYVTVAVAVCSALDAALPQPLEGSRWVGPRKLLAFVALNLGHARNLVRPGTISAAVAAALAPKA